MSKESQLQVYRFQNKTTDLQLVWEGGGSALRVGTKWLLDSSVCYPNQEQAFLCAGHDGAACAIDGGKLYVDLDWLLQEFPGHKGLLKAKEATMAVGTRD